MESDAILKKAKIFGLLCVLAVSAFGIMSVQENQEDTAKSGRQTLLAEETTREDILRVQNGQVNLGRKANASAPSMERISDKEREDAIRENSQNIPTHGDFGKYQGDTLKKEMVYEDKRNLFAWMKRQDIREDICGGNYRNCTVSEDGFYIKNHKTSTYLFRCGNSNIYGNDKIAIPPAFLTEKGYAFCQNDFSNCKLTDEGLKNVVNGKVLNLPES